MTKQHYGAIILVLIGYAVARVFSFRVVDGLGAIGGHHRPGDYAVGVVIGAIPLLTLTVYAVLLLVGVDVEGRLWVTIQSSIGLVVAGGAMGLLPYSRFGTETNLVEHERSTAPGFLHALDVTIAVGLVVVVVLLLVSLRVHARQRAASDRPLG